MTATVERLEQAGSAVGLSLLADADPVDLRDDIDPGLQAPGPAARARGCPCGCGDTELLELARSGDDTALACLLERYRGLARIKAKSYFLLGGDRDDVVQEGVIGVYNAIRDFEDGRGASFRTFAELCVTRQIITAVKAASRQKHEPLSRSLSLDQPVGRDDEGSTLADLLPASRSEDPADVVVDADEVRALQRHFDEVLTDLEAQVLRHHVEGKTYQEIAGMLQRHAKSIDNTLQRIRRKMQLHVETRSGAELR